MVGGQPKLEEVSPAYRAYVALHRLPKDAPHLERSNDGTYTVETKELFCRVRGCGNKLAVGVLRSHLLSVHNIKVEPGRQGGGNGVNTLTKTQEFYINLMSEVLYPGKRSIQEETAATDRFRAERQAVTSTCNHLAEWNQRTRKMGTQSGLEDNATSHRNGSADDDNDYEGYDYSSKISDDYDDDDDERHKSDSVAKVPSTRPSRRRHSPAFSTSLDMLVTDRPEANGPEKSRRGGWGSPENSMPKRTKREASMSVEPVIKDEEHHFILIDDGAEAETEEVDAEEDIEDIEFEMEKTEIEQAQLQARLKMVQLKQKMATVKKRKARC